MAPWDAAGGGGGMLGGVARGCVFTSAGESGIAVAFSFLSAVDATGVGDGRKRQREGESGQGVEGLALPRPTCFLGEAPSSWSPGGGHSAHSPPRRSPRCAHRWLASHPPGIRQQDGSAHFRYAGGRSFENLGRQNRPGVLIVGVTLGSLGFLNCRSESQEAPPEAVVPPLP